VPSPAEQDCALSVVHEAIKEHKRLPNSYLGMRACLQCLGVFYVDPAEERGSVIDNPGHVTCLLGYSNAEGAHLDE